MRVLSTVVIALALTASGAQAQVFCKDRDSILGQLAQVYDEHTEALGITDTGKMIEVLTSQQGTWTIVVTEPSGHTCVMAAGQAWETIDSGLRAAYQTGTAR